MKKRRLGKTNIMVSEVGFGGIPIQRITQREAEKVIKFAVEGGINFIDTARGYGVSEEYIGNALLGIREKVYIASKSMARTKDAMKEDIERSLKNLRTDYIDLYQLHNVKDEETLKQVMTEGGALEALLEAKNSGKILHIGITSHSLDLLKKILEYDVFETIMYPYNIVEDQAEKLFEEAKERDIGVIAMKPLAGGALEDSELAISYILNNKNISTVIPGMDSIEQVKQNISAVDIEFNDEMMKKCKEIKEKYTQSFCRRCGYCMPCPQGIDIPFSFILKGYYDRYDLKAWATERYTAMKRHASDCIKCGLCETKCPYNLKIRDMLREVVESFGF
ncbi:aldo/keto reductase [Caloramator proteoclasticus]|uniref:Predicted oxidoreductase of the aldo/keto reductase family n=1 Tax=Caloramator proteoclasticus DSM 10124 TaxID=1121262 RepID=A0A1M5B6X4_9CLOT|nr:aldo/keto reductase [Caloramator proteoclasticus]SHF38166.1 Predicted oxidoreductase of the aldo/keto reductase family [Caloramator proteoclasticus DSM 10124]